MRIAFELVGDSVGVNDLSAAVEPFGVVTRVIASTSLGKHGPVPILLAVFEADGRVNRNRLAQLLRDSLKLSGIEVNHG